MNRRIQYKWLKRLWMPFCLLVCLVTVVLQAEGQEKPPRPITVSCIQNLCFGSFIQNGASGTITVSYSGARLSTGSIIIPLTSSIVSPAVFVINAEPGTLITIMDAGPAFLSGPISGSLILDMDKSSLGNPFITTATETEVSIGGMLTVGSLLEDNAGNYGGTFKVIFIQQ